MCIPYGLPTYIHAARGALPVRKMYDVVAFAKADKAGGTTRYPGCTHRYTQTRTRLTTAKIWHLVRGDVDALRYFGTLTGHSLGFFFFFLVFLVFVFVLEFIYSLHLEERFGHEGQKK